jgi:archaellum component FlaG (FlaF/FlaG flagellin family)
MNSKLYHAAIPMVAILLVAAVAPGLAGATGESTAELVVGVDQSGEDVTVTITQNDTAVENATVTVAALNNGTYAGDGEYVTDANGSVALPAPEENLSVEVVAEKGNASGSTTAELVAVEDEEQEFDSFGQRVSWFVHSLLGDEGGEGGIGDAVSEFVKSNNPSNDNSPEHAGNDKQNKSSGGGPPDHAGNDKGDDSEDDEE